MKGRINMIYYANENSPYIQHYGVLGMKWGARRYRNKDGSLTSNGRKRYQSEDEEKETSSKREKPKILENGGQSQNELFFLFPFLFETVEEKEINEKKEER